MRVVISGLGGLVYLAERTLNAHHNVSKVESSVLDTQDLLEGVVELRVHNDGLCGRVAFQQAIVRADIRPRSEHRSVPKLLREFEDRMAHANESRGHRQS